MTYIQDGVIVYTVLGAGPDYDGTGEWKGAFAWCSDVSVVDGAAEAFKDRLNVSPVATAMISITTRLSAIADEVGFAASCLTGQDAKTLHELEAKVEAAALEASNQARVQLLTVPRCEKGLIDAIDNEN